MLHWSSHKGENAGRKLTCLDWMLGHLGALDSGDLSWLLRPPEFLEFFNFDTDVHRYLKYSKRQIKSIWGTLISLSELNNSNIYTLLPQRTENSQDTKYFDYGNCPRTEKNIHLLFSKRHNVNVNYKGTIISWLLIESGFREWMHSAFSIFWVNPLIIYLL